MTSTPEVAAGAASPIVLGGSSLEDEVAYYKAQYEQLELELQDFQASSRELETELEKDIEASEKRERQLQEKVEALGFEVEEWKTKYKQAKAEANNAQNQLQKEITSLRDTNRTLQLKLRDIEVANDDFERQARNTTSSLEDLESKFNVSIERGVMLEEEIKTGEQEREALRIDSQRLRDELSDLKVEAEIVQEKLRHAEANIEELHKRRPSPLAMDARPHSPTSEASTSATTLSSPTVSTPPPSHSEPSTATPPSPPLSETSANPKVAPVTPVPRKPGLDAAKRRNTAPRPSLTNGRTVSGTMRVPSQTRGPSASASNFATPSAGARQRSATGSSRAPRSSIGGPHDSALPRSGSLYQIRGLIGKMQKLEERVHSARSKLPAPVATPPRASPRSSYIPSTVTVRSARKRTSMGGSTNSSVKDGSTNRSTTTAPTSAPTTDLQSGVGMTTSVSGAGEKVSRIGRLSFGPGSARPTSAASISRPDSRASITSHSSSIPVPTPQRPSSRASLGGARTPLGHYASLSMGAPAGTASGLRRPRSSISGSYSNASSQSRRESLVNASVGADDEDEDIVTPLAKRGSIVYDSSAIPMPAQSGLPVHGSSRRQSGGGGDVRRGSTAGLAGLGDSTSMRPPPNPVGARKAKAREKDVGETY